MIRIVLIDDHPVLREGIAKLLSNLDNFNVIEQFGDGNEFVANFDRLKKCTDLFILDYSMPSLSGIEILERIHNDLEDANFLILSHSNDAHLKYKFYSLGAKGFLSKMCTGEELKEAVSNVVEKGFYNIKENVELIKNAVKNFNIAQLLTKRELEFIELSCDENEYTYLQIANLMKVSVKTVDYYRKNVFEKLNVKSKTGLVLFSYKNKLTKPFL